jgi:hypothetical protein
MVEEKRLAAMAVRLMVDVFLAIWPQILKVVT